MRHQSSLISSHKPQSRGPLTGRARRDEKAVGEPKQAPKKRSLNEAAHKLGR